MTNYIFDLDDTLYTRGNILYNKKLNNLLIKLKSKGNLRIFSNNTRKTGNNILKTLKIKSLFDKKNCFSNDIDTFNSENDVNKSILINGRNLTNLGVFRKYLQSYIETHSAINKDMTIMTRQLAPTSQGLPLEIYAFSSDKRWENYEYIISDIFDHSLAAVPYFNLEIFELTSGNSEV